MDIITTVDCFKKRDYSLLNSQKGGVTSFVLDGWSTLGSRQVYIEENRYDHW